MIKKKRKKANRKNEQEEKRKNGDQGKKRSGKKGNKWANRNEEYKRGQKSTKEDKRPWNLRINHSALASNRWSNVIKSANMRNSRNVPAHGGARAPLRWEWGRRFPSPVFHSAWLQRRWESKVKTGPFLHQWTSRL